MFFEFLTGIGAFIAYYIVVAMLALAFKFVLKPPDELMRKLLHLICFMSVFVLLYAFKTWYLAALSAIAFALLIYPALAILEKHTRLMDLLCQRKNGEIKASLMLVFGMMAALITIFWGLLGEQWKYIIIVAIMAWGFGDAAAALVGKALGRHPVRSRFVDGKKTIEGYLAMCAVSGAAIFITLLTYAPVSWYLSLATALVVAPLCALIELLSHKGTDTVNVPFATALPVFVMMYLFTSLGV